MTATILQFAPMVKKLDRWPNRIRELRIAKGLTQNQLAEITGAGKGTQIGRFETGERELTLPWMRRIAKGLDTDVGMLLNPEDNQDAIDEAVANVAEQMQGVLGKVAQGARAFRHEADEETRRA